MKVTYKQHCGDDLMVVNAARVSFDKESDWMYDGHEPILSGRDEKLINFLAREGHFSPFNHTFITMHVKAPIFVARQLVKHKFMPWNEVSRRYVDEDPEFYEPDWRMRAANVKQGSGGEFSELEQACVNEDYEMLKSGAMQTYNWLLDQNVCPEQARMVLPQSMMTQWYWSGTLGAWAAMYNLRIKSDTQKETQEIAQQVGKLIEPLFPVSWEALTNADTIS